MKIIQPKVELWKQGEDAKAHVARCARVCYGRESGNDEATIKRLINNHHWSMFRHETIYAMIPHEYWDKIIKLILPYYKENYFIKYITFNDYIYVSTNGNFILDIEKNNSVLWEYIKQYRVSEEEFNSCEYAWKYLARYTFCIDTQIITSRELNRVSPNNIAERSTRYVYEDGSICKPWWFDDKDLYAKHHLYYEDVCKAAFHSYHTLIDCGMHRQDARGVLPLDTATRCIYTYSIDEWRHIIDLRYYGTTGVPHPNAKIIAGMIRQKLMELGYDFK